jgi:molybdate transport system substrate-binding protein
MRAARYLLTIAYLLLALQAPALAGTVKVMISGGFSPAYADLVEVYQKRSGDTVVTIHGPSMGADPTAIPARLARGEEADVVILARAALDKLVESQVVMPGGTDLGIGRIGMAVKAGAPRPDIGTVEAFRRTLLAAKSIAFPDAASGFYMRDVLFKKLGIEKEMAAKSHMIQATPVGLNIARGEYELGFQNYSELKPIAGIDIVGFIPDAVQLEIPYTAALAAKAPNPAGAKALIDFLASPAAYGAIRNSGLKPAQEK